MALEPRAAVGIVKVAKFGPGASAKCLLHEGRNSWVGGKCPMAPCVPRRDHSDARGTGTTRRRHRRICALRLARRLAEAPPATLVPAVRASLPSAGRWARSSSRGSFECRSPPRPRRLPCLYLRSPTRPASLMLLFRGLGHAESRPPAAGCFLCARCPSPFGAGNDPPGPEQPRFLRLPLVLRARKR